MKSALALLKLVAFLLALQWLCSCNGNHANYRMQLDYVDSMGIATRRIQAITLHKDSIRNEFTQLYPAVAFPLTPAGTRARKAWALQERAAYKDMIGILRAYDTATAFEQYALELKCIRYQQVIDSLKQLK